MNGYNSITTGILLLLFFYTAATKISDESVFDQRVLEDDSLELEAVTKISDQKILEDDIRELGLGLEANIATRFGIESLEMGLFKVVMEKVEEGLEKSPKKLLEPGKRRMVAYHEAGHVVAGWFLANPILKVSIIPSGNFLGYTLHEPGQKYLMTADELMDEMCMILGGGAAEIIHFGSLTTGAWDDLHYATEKAYDQIRTYGMNEELGHISLSDFTETHYSEATAQMLDLEVRKMINYAMDITKTLLKRHQNSVIAVAEGLLEREILELSDLEEILGPRPFDHRSTYHHDFVDVNIDQEDFALKDSETCDAQESSQIADETGDNDSKSKYCTDSNTKEGSCSMFDILGLPYQFSTPSSSPKRAKSKVLLKNSLP